MVKGGFAGLILALAVLALNAASSWAIDTPVVSSVTPNEAGSAGNFKLIIRGEHLEEISGVHYGGVSATKIITSGTLTKGECKLEPTIEIECLTPFHEHSKVHVTVTNNAGTSAATTADELTFLPEVYRNEVAIGAAHVPVLGYGQMDFTSPQQNNTIECVVVGFGGAWNQGPPTRGHGEILTWWASGHTPGAEHTELSSRCRFIYHGTEENQPNSPVAWVSTEPSLNLVNQEGLVCANQSEKELAQCPNESERVDTTVARAVSREGLSLPWNVGFSESEGGLRVGIGLPDECKGKIGAERTELAKCPEASEREAGKSSESCNIPPPPDPIGCVKVQVLSPPPLNVHQVFEGFFAQSVDALNSGPNGLSPSSWEFEGLGGEMHLRESPSTEGESTGSMKILGYSGQELISVK